jgi:probable HAF family extracellular repeat protein
MTPVAPRDATAQAISTRDLGTLPGGQNSYGAAINDNGQVAGDSDANGSRHVAFLWQAGKFTIFPLLSGTTLAVVNGMNGAGAVVGYSILGVGINHATLWQNRTALDLGTLGGPSSFAEGVNLAGQVVGFSDDAVGDRRAFVWQNGMMTVLPTL